MGSAEAGADHLETVSLQENEAFVDFAPDGLR
jgi:hypothetical protein